MSGVSFIVEFEELNSGFNVDFSETNTSFEVDFGVIQAIPLDPYTGVYEVTPKIYSETVLLTEMKSMLDNVTVHKVPQFAVDNLAGGLTLTIGADNL